MIELSSVATVYPYGARLFGALNLTIADGEIVAVLGGDGAGKTSFLKTVAALVEFEGEVKIDGETVKKRTNDIVMVFDDLAVFKFRTVFYNLAYPLKIRGLKKAEIKERVENAAAKLGISACLNIRADKLNLDEKKRMALARLYVRSAKVWLLDDVTSGLIRADAEKLWRELIPLFAEAKKNGVSIVFSTSNADEAVSVSDRIVALHAGEIKQIGTVCELLTSPSSAWAAESIDPYYNIQSAVLCVKNEVLTLCFGKTELNAECFKDRIFESYIGKSVLVGCHADGFAESGNLETVSYATCMTDGYILRTESGLNIKSIVKKDKICTLPNLKNAVLYDATNENCIMKQERTQNNHHKNECVVV